MIATLTILLCCAALSSAANRRAQPQSVAPKKTAQDAEIERIESGLKLIRHDPAARKTFYEQIEELVQRIRSGRGVPHAPMAALEPAPLRQFAPNVPNPALATRPEPEIADVEVSPRSPELVAPALLSAPGSTPLPGRRDQTDSDFIPGLRSPDVQDAGPKVVSRLIYWAQKNGCPPNLALATAWQESRLSLYPPDGSSGEIGIMQILPARAVAEGVDPGRLRNPEVDMWLGTKLLARYYREEGSVRRAAMKYVAGPNVFAHHYPPGVRRYIRWYSNSVLLYAAYFAKHAA
jgi:soluble lytic murein transglycosylase-like protein